MKPRLAAVVLALLVTATPAIAGVTLDFEGPTSFASIAEYYNGGTDSEGVPGPGLGVSFGLDALGLKNDEFFTYFSNAPSPLGVMAPVGPDATMNVAGGFTSLSFFYSASDDVIGGVQVWSGLGGQGTLLLSFDLAKNAEAGGDHPFDHFDRLVSGLLAGTAHSVTFTNAVGFAGFDDITITAVPEPLSAWLAAVGLAGLLRLRRR